MTQLLSALRNNSRGDDALAITVNEQSMSQNQLLTTALAFGESVAALNPSRHPVAVCAVPTLDTVIAVVGCILTGTTVVPVPPDAGDAEVTHILTDSGCSVWAGPGRNVRDLPVAKVDHNALPSGTPADLSADAVAMILYTSGTTGAPKGVLLSYGAIAAGLEGLADAWDWTSEDTLAHGLPLFHTHGLILGILGPLHLGSRIIHTGKPTPERYAAAQATMYFGVPTVWNRIVNDETSARALSSARLLISGSAPLPVPLFNRIRELTGHAPVERYGMTETMITLSTRADGESRPGWVGLPLKGVSTRVRSDSGDLVPADGESIGRLEVRAPMLFSGYLNREVATRAAWTDDGWFITGDLAAVSADGFHRIVGRESVDLIKSGGFRIGAGEIESSLLARPEVQEVAVVGLADDDLGQRITAFIVAETAHRTDEVAKTLVAHVADDLSWHKRPRDIVFVNELPRNAMGKVQKKKLTMPATKDPSGPGPDRFADFLGIEVTRNAPGEVEASAAVTKENLNPHSTAHGAFLFSLAGAAVAAAANDADTSGVARTISMDYLRPAHPGDTLRAVTSVEEALDRETLFTVRIANGDGLTVAVATARFTRKLRA